MCRNSVSKARAFVSKASVSKARVSVPEARVSVPEARVSVPEFSFRQRVSICRVSEVAGVKARVFIQGILFKGGRG